jgi:predicted transcriptional regulator
MNTTTTQAIEKYIRSIRNAYAKNYAKVYYELAKMGYEQHINRASFSLDLMTIQQVETKIINLMEGNDDEN